MSNVTLDRLVASEIMQRDVVTIAPRETLRDALTLMTENHVTGLPVMDEKSHCIGLITASDILNYEQDHADESSEQEMIQHFNPETEQWESIPVTAYGLEEMGDVRVEDVMTQGLIYVHRDAPLKEVAKKMLDAQVHRVLVMDEGARLYGIVSSFDFVRVMAET